MPQHHHISPTRLVKAGSWVRATEGDVPDAWDWRGSGRVQQPFPRRWVQLLCKRGDCWLVRPFRCPSNRARRPESRATSPLYRYRFVRGGGWQGRNQLPHLHHLLGTTVKTTMGTGNVGPPHTQAPLRAPPYSERVHVHPPCSEEGTMSVSADTSTGIH